MAGLRDDVLEALAQVAGPDGTPLPATGTLSDIVVTDGKVFFSITVDAAAVKEWEPVRERAEAGVRAVPGVASALVALTGERASGASGAPPRRPQMPPGAARPQAGAGRGPQSPTGIPGVEAIIAVASGKGGVGKSTTAVLRSGFSMPTSTARQCPSCWPFASARRPSAALGSNRFRVTAWR
jgi:ATP-binding protein involved in chromosome partitioning